MRGVSNRRPQPRVVLECDTADAALDLIRILLTEIFHDVKFHVASTFARESVDRVDVADSLESLTHEYESLFFDLDDPAAGVRIRLKRIPRDRSRGRRRLIEQDRDGDIALLSKALRINILRLSTV